MPYSSTLARSTPCPEFLLGGPAPLEGQIAGQLRWELRIAGQLRTSFERNRRVGLRAYSCSAVTWASAIGIERDNNAPGAMTWYSYQSSGPIISIM